MAESKSSDSGNNIGCSLAVFATVVLVILKLAGVISWSWWLVFSPVPILIAIGIVYTLIVLILAGLGIGAFAGVVGIGTLAQKLANRHKVKKAEEQTRFAQARPLGIFNSAGEKVKPREPHSWMF